MAHSIGAMFEEGKILVVCDCASQHCNYDFLGCSLFLRMDEILYLPKLYVYFNPDLQNHAGHHEVGTGHGVLSEDGIKKMIGLYTSPWWDSGLK